MVAFKSVDIIGLWMNFVSYRHKDSTKPEILLLPMIHAADEAFYEEVYWEKWASDVVLLEGVRIPVSRALGKAYKIVAAGRKLKLAAQSTFFGRKSAEDNRPSENSKEADGWYREKPGAAWQRDSIIDYREQGWKVPPRLFREVRADIGPVAAAKALKTIPFWFWLAAPIAILVASVFIRFMDREEFVEKISGNGEPEFGDSWFERPMRDFYRFVTETRDGRLAEVLSGQCADPENARKTISVKFGSAHMKKLHKHITGELGYKPVSERWVLAIASDLDIAEECLFDGYGQAESAYYDRLVEQHESAVEVKRLEDEEDQGEISTCRPVEYAT